MNQETLGTREEAGDARRSVPAHQLHVELGTRISTKRLHYRSGNEETAAKSLHTLFQTTRKLMVEHPEDERFQTVALVLLNEILRPYLARWHGWMTQDSDKTDSDGNPVLRFRDEWTRRKFREELRELQPLLHGANKTFDALSRKEPPKAEWLNPPKDSPEYNALLREVCGGPSPRLSAKPLPSVIRPQVPLHAAAKDGVNPDSNVACSLLEAEQAHIRARRESMGGQNEGSGVNDAFGLALSGGGIRSATFCLGVVQALHKRGLFRQVDYLSTVSGGGYLGTFLTSYLGYQPALGEDRVSPHPKDRLNEVLGASLEDDQGKPRTETAEPAPLRHLRNNSKYLLNGGPLAILHIAAVFLNGVLAAFLMLLSLPLILAWLVRGAKAADPLVPNLLHPVIHWLPDGLGNLPIFQRPGAGLLASLLLLSVVLLALRPLVQRLAEGKSWTSPMANARGLVENTGNLLALGTLLTALLCGSFLWVETYESFRSSDPTIHFSKMLPAVPDWVVGLLSALVPTLLGLLSKRKDGTPRRWAKWLFLLTGPLFILITFTIIASYLGVGTRVENFQAWMIGSALLLAWIFLALNINTFALHRYYRDRLCECYLAVPKATEIGLLKRGLESLVHGNCPDRSRGSTQVGTVQFSPLSKAGDSPAAPYHLINAVLNASASHNPELRGRNGDFFLFSRAYCGSPLTGYITTQAMESANPGLDLGTAMAISGAAASTNMGSKTRREFRFLMTLFNIRLGYWMRRPGLDREAKSKFRKLASRLFSGPGPLYFFREMTGALHERTRYINLSDGGHIENLAAYELLRRQCKFIVCVDAGMEPGMECADLMRLQRLAEIDFGIRMHFDPTELSLLPTRYSRAYGVLVKIDYAPEEAAAGRETSDQLGWMLYLKLALTGTEPRHVLDYHRQNPAFPHQTTGDQFYDEAQFESYRCLGRCAASSLFREEIIGPEQTGKELTVADWFDLLAGSLLPDNDEAIGSASTNSR